GVGPSGLFLATALPFRLGHPPLFVPWSDVRARRAKTWLGSAVELGFTKAPKCVVRFRGSVARAILEAWERTDPGVDGDAAGREGLTPSA
ncbi:MAG: hypothetical protein R3F34_05435, partial [Planctomycetota bacterium]